MSTLATPQTSTTTWNIDPVHSVAEFKVKHMMISNVKGQFAKVTGALTLDESDLAKSRVEASIEAASIETRDAHLKSAAFLHVEKFPTLSFDPTVRGVTRRGLFTVAGPTPPAKDPWGNTRVAVSATQRSTARTSA
jgi:polyisoprenoid-binding protein YceI